MLSELPHDAAPRSFWSSIALAAVLLISPGCASVPREAGFGDVRDSVAQRTGARVHWFQGGDEDRQVIDAIDMLLAEPLSVDSATQIALLNNRDLQATYEDLLIAQADLVAAGLLSNPVFSAEVKVLEAGGGTNLEFSVVQTFLELLYIPMRKRIAEGQFEAAKRLVAAEALNLVRQTHSAFYGFQASQQRLEMRRQIVDATEASYTLSRRLFEAGNITELDLASERALYEQARLDLSAAEIDLVRRREELNTLMGLWGERTGWAIEGRLPEPADREIDPADAERQAVANNLELAASAQAASVAAARLGIAGPQSVMGETELGVAAEREADGAWGVGPAFSIPLPLWSQGQPAVAAAEAELRRAASRHGAAAVRLRSRVRAVHAELREARDRVHHYRAVVLPLRQRIVEESMLQYNAMQIGTFQLLVARQEQIRAGEGFIDALEDYWVARTELQWLLGGRAPRPPDDSAATSRGGVPGSPLRQSPDNTPHHDHSEHHR